MNPSLLLSVFWAVNGSICQKFLKGCKATLPCSCFIMLCITHTDINLDLLQEELMSADGLNGNQPSSITGALLPGAKPPLAPKPDLLPKPKSKKSKSESLLSRSLG